MPREEDRSISLDDLKVDPRLWMRLATPMDKGDALTSVFKEKENPFTKNGKDAMDKVKQLASEGKLFIRENGRSRHFNELKLDGDELKLGQQQDRKLENGNSNFVMGGLLWLTRAWFRWIGINFLANWIDRKMERRATLGALDSQYKKEYNDFSADEKKELKERRKIEKNQKKIEKLEKKLAELKKNLKEQQNQNAGNPKEETELNSPLSSTDEVTTNENTLQPNLLGDHEVQNQDTKEITKDDKPKEKETTQLDTKDEKKEEKKEDTAEKETQDEIIFGNTKYTQENIKELPEIVQAALKVILEFTAQQKETQRQKEQKETVVDINALDEQPEVYEDINALDEQPEVYEDINAVEMPVVDINAVETPVVDINAVEAPVVDINAVETPAVDINAVETLAVDINAVDEPAVDINAPDEQPITMEETKPPVEQSETTVETNTPIEQPAAFDDINAMFDEPFVPEEQSANTQKVQSTLQEKLAIEKQEMDAVKNWKEQVSTALFSHEAGGAMKAEFESIQNDEARSFQYLSGAVLGVLANKTDTPEKKQQVMDGLLSGKSAGNENHELISNGMKAYKDAMDKLAQGNREPMAKMIADAAMELGRQASRENGLSPRNVMIGRLISNAMITADEHTLTLPWTKEDQAKIRGAFNLATFAQKYHDARQHLGKEPMDMTSTKGKEAVRDLLVGNFVEKMLQKDYEAGEDIANTQIIIGRGAWSVENLQKMINSSATRREIGQEQIEKMLQEPNSTSAFSMAQKITDEIIPDEKKIQNALTQSMQRENVANQEIEQPKINPMLPNG